jgi:hypothetical protein
MPCYCKRTNRLTWWHHKPVFPLVTPRRRVLPAKLTVALLVSKFQNVYTIRSLLPCSQESATSPCPEPEESNPHPHSPLKSTIFPCQIRKLTRHDFHGHSGSSQAPTRQTSIGAPASSHCTPRPEVTSLPVAQNATVAQLVWTGCLPNQTKLQRHETESKWRGVVETPAALHGGGYCSGNIQDFYLAGPVFVPLLG